MPGDVISFCLLQWIQVATLAADLLIFLYSLHASFSSGADCAERLWRYWCTFRVISGRCCCAVCLVACRVTLKLVESVVLLDLLVCLCNMQDLLGPTYFMKKCYIMIVGICFFNYPVL